MTPMLGIMASSILKAVKPTAVEYLVVAGGGGGNPNLGAGGGAGGYRTATGFAVSSGVSITVTVGGGGAGGYFSGSWLDGTAGSTSTFSTINSSGSKSLNVWLVIIVNYNDTYYFIIFI